MGSPFTFPELPPPLQSPPTTAQPIPEAFLNDAAHVEDAAALSVGEGRVGHPIFEARGVASFNGFDLSKEVLKGVYVQMKFDRPSEIQALSLPLICKPPYHSIIAQAQNGSGKTCCFVVCILTRLDYTMHFPQALVVVPTRELAIQNEEVIKQMGGSTGVTTLSSRHTDEERRPKKITEMVVVSTMGTLQKWRTRGLMTFSHLKVVVFDEADTMIHERDFGDQSLMLMLCIDQEAELPQLLLFSATYDETVKKYTERLFSTFKRPHVQKIFIPKEELPLDTIAQANIKVSGFREKLEMVTRQILPLCTRGKVIIFVRSRIAAEHLHRTLTNEGWSVTAIAGDLHPLDRDRVVEEFIASVTNILVATDVLARGFDVADVTVVINFDVPKRRETWDADYETYLHRVGRSGRFRRQGAAFNLVDVDNKYGSDAAIMEDIAQYYDREIKDVNGWDEEELTRFMALAGVIGQ